MTNDVRPQHAPAPDADGEPMTGTPDTTAGQQSQGRGGLRALAARRWVDPTFGASYRYDYLAVVAAVLVVTIACLLWVVGDIAVLASWQLWVLITLTVVTGRLEVPVAATGTTFLLNDFAMIAAAMALPSSQCAALILVSALVFQARRWHPLTRMLGTVWLYLPGRMVFLAVAGLAVRELGGASWGWVLVAGATGTLVAAAFNYSELWLYRFTHREERGLWAAARSALERTLNDILVEDREMNLLDASVNVALAPIAYLAFVHAPWSVLMLIFPIALLSWQTRRALVAAERSRELDEMREQMGLDALTRLHHRERFSELAVQRIVDAQRSGAPVAVVMCDLDHFKQLNDTRGHQAGDEVIVGAAAVLREIVGDDGIVGRYGGEEFVALLGGLDRDAAQLAAELVCTTIERELSSFSMTASVGLVHLPVVPAAMSVVSGETGSDENDAAAPFVQASALLTELISQADGALYDAKRSGRNRVCAAGGRGVSLSAAVLPNADAGNGLAA